MVLWIIRYTTSDQYLSVKGLMLRGFVLELIDGFLTPHIYQRSSTPVLCPSGNRTFLISQRKKAASVNWFIRYFRGCILSAYVPNECYTFLEVCYCSVTSCNCEIYILSVYNVLFGFWKAHIYHLEEKFHLSGPFSLFSSHTSEWDEVQSVGGIEHPRFP